MLSAKEKVRDAWVFKIEQAREFVRADRFYTASIFELRNRKDVLENDFQLLTHTHIDLIEETEEPTNHYEKFRQTQRIFLEAMAVLDERIAEQENAMCSTNESSNEATVYEKKVNIAETKEEGACAEANVQAICADKAIDRDAEDFSALIGTITEELEELEQLQIVENRRSLQDTVELASSIYAQCQAWSSLRWEQALAHIIIGKLPLSLSTKWQVKYEPTDTAVFEKLMSNLCAEVKALNTEPRIQSTPDPVEEDSEQNPIMQPVAQTQHCNTGQSQTKTEQKLVHGCRNMWPIVQETQVQMRRDVQIRDVHANRAVCQHGVLYVKCYHCAGPHPMALCNAFKSLELTARINRVQELGLCRNCFSNNHRAESRSCKAHPCKICAGQQLSQRWHNTLLCDNRPPNDEPEVEGAASMAYQRGHRQTR